MKFFVLSDKPDVYLGMRLAGMDGEVVSDREEALRTVRRIVAAGDVGILLMTGELMGPVRTGAHRHPAGEPDPGSSPGSLTARVKAPPRGWSAMCTSPGHQFVR